MPVSYTHLDVYKRQKVGLYHAVIDWHHPSYDNTICPDLCYPAGQAAMLNRKNIPRDHAAYQKYLLSLIHI